MDVQQIKFFRFKDLEHLGGQREGVWRMVEERVGDHLGLVEVDARVLQVHADRRGVADEMDVVIARGEFLAEFSGNDTRAAIGGIAGYADAHSSRVTPAFPCRGLAGAWYNG